MFIEVCRAGCCTAEEFASRVVRRPPRPAFDSRKSISASSTRARFSSLLMSFNVTSSFWSGERSEAHALLCSSVMLLAGYCMVLDLWGGEDGSLERGTVSDALRVSRNWLCGFCDNRGLSSSGTRDLGVCLTDLPRRTSVSTWRAFVLSSRDVGASSSSYTWDGSSNGLLTPFVL